MKTDVYLSNKEVLLATPTPKETRTYKPITNQQLIDLTLASISEAGLVVDKEIYSSAREGNVSNGRYVIKNVSDAEMQLQITWRNSYDKSLPVVFSIGALIKVCNNGMHVSQGLGHFRKKHRGTVQEYTPYAISEYMKKASSTFEEMQRERDIMKGISLSRTEQAELIGRMFIEEEFVRSTQVNIIRKELRNPSHDYGDPNSLWSLYQYTTFAMREDHPSLYLQDHLNAHKFFVNAAGILVEDKPVVYANVPDPNQLDLFSNSEH